MKSQWQGLIFAIGFMVSATALAQQGPLATGQDGVKVTADEVIADVNMRVPPESRATVLSNPSNVAQLASSIALRRALAAEAEKQQLDKDPHVAYQLRLAREQILADARIEQAEGSPPDMATFERLAQSEYRANPDKYAIPEKIRVRHILIDARSCDAQKRIGELLVLAKAPGADFAKLAVENSQDGSAQRGGDLGLITRGQMDPEFEKAAFALQRPGEISGVIRSAFGFHIIKLEARVPASREPFEKVRDAIVRDLATREQKRRRSEATAAFASKIAVNGAEVEEFAKQH
jgi:peptidyl-prolyl cis-trans isomerase C